MASVRLEWFRRIGKYTLRLTPDARRHCVISLCRLTGMTTNNPDYDFDLGTRSETKMFHAPGPPGRED